MDALATVDGFLRQVGSQLGTSLGLDEDGRCALDCGSDPTCVVAVPEGGADTVLFYAPLLAVPAAGDRVTLFERCLSLNLHGAGTDGCTLGYDDVSDEIVLALSLPLALVPADIFGTLLGNFIRTTRRLALVLAEQPDGAGSPPQQRPDPKPASVADLLMNMQWRA
jgi:hypothetical protein